MSHGPDSDADLQSASPADSPAGPAADEAPLRCDFCGDRAESVRRVALDADYDRLQIPHRVQYACGPCSERKERERRGSGA